jgi:hypothetical protein
MPRLPFIEFVPDANSNTRGPVKGRIDRAAIPSVRPRDGSGNDPLSYPIGKRREAVATAIGGGLVAAETALREMRRHLWLPSFDSTHNHRRNFGEQWRHWACANDVAPATMDRRLFQPSSSSVPWSPRNKNRQILRYSTTLLGTADEFGATPQAQFGRSPLSVSNTTTEPRVGRWSTRLRIWGFESFRARHG